MSISGATQILMVVGWLGAIVYSRYFIRTFINPVIIFSSMWLITYSLFSLRLLNYYPLETNTCLVISIGYTSSMLGLTLPFLYMKPARSKPVDYSVAFPHRRFNFFIVVFYLIGLLGFYLLYRDITRYFSPSDLLNPLTYPTLRQMNIGDQIGGRLIDYLLISNEIALVFSVFYAVCFRRKYIRIFLFFVTALLYTVISTGRGLVFVYIFDLFGAYLFVKRFVQQEVVSKTILVLFPVLLVASFGGIGILLMKSSQFTRHIDTENMIESQLYMIYFYLTGSLGALNRFLMQDPMVQEHGRNVFAPFLRLFSMVIPDLSVPPLIQDFTNVPYKTNVYTYLRILVQDFGYVGITVFPFGIGAIISKLWGKLSARGDITFLPLACHLSFVVFMTVFQDMFFRTTLVLVYLYAVAFLRLSGVTAATRTDQSVPASSR